MFLTRVNPRSASSEVETVAATTIDSPGAVNHDEGVTVNIPVEAELDAIYETISSSDFKWDGETGKTRPMLSVKWNPYAYVPTILKHGTPEQLAALLKKHPGAWMNNAEFPIMAAEAGNAPCLKYLGMLGLDLTRGIAGSENSNPWPAPVACAMRNLDKQCLKVLDEYQAIEKATPRQLAKGAAFALKACDGNNGAKVIECLRYVFNVLDRDHLVEFKRKSLKLLEQRIEFQMFSMEELYGEVMINVFKHNQSDVLKVLLDYGINLAASMTNKASGANTAAKYGALECLQVLAVHGSNLSANVTVCDNYREEVRVLGCHPYTALCQLPLSIIAGLLCMPSFCYTAAYVRTTGTALSHARHHPECERFLNDWFKYQDENPNTTQEDRQRFVDQWSGREPGMQPVVMGR